MTAQRLAVDALMDLYQARDFNDHGLATNVKVLGDLCHHPLAHILGGALLAAEQVKQGHWESLETMEQCVVQGMGAHQLPNGTRWHLGGLMHLQPVLDAILAAARAVPAPAQFTQQPRIQRIALVISNLSVGAATTLVAKKFASALRTLIPEVYVVRTGHASTTMDEPFNSDSAALQVIDTNGHDVHSRANRTVELLSEIQPDAIIYYTWPSDLAAQIASCVRACPKQMFINHTCDQKVGAFDVRICYTKNFQALADPDRCCYAPPVRVREELREEIEPANLAKWNINTNQIVLGNYSRLSKCVDDAFLEAMCTILRRNPNTVLVLPGLPDPASEFILRDRFGAYGVLPQVRFPGFLGDDYLPLLRATRVYCDTFVWTGGQSVLDAMAMGVPVVTSRPDPSKTPLDPTGISPVSLACTYVPDAAMVANAGSIEGYIEIVQRLLEDDLLYALHVEKNIQRSKELAWPQYPGIVMEILNNTPPSHWQV